MDLMNSQAHVIDQENALMAAKKARQEESRALVNQGTKNQQSMFLIQPSTVNKTRVVHRVLSFD
jgi:ATP-dependent Clp protease ATP-binding subunit ClpA